jgi:hypothetical protein
VIVEHVFGHVVADPLDSPTKGKLIQMRRRAFLAAALSSISARGQSPSRWQRQRIGANCFNHRVSPAWIESAAASGIALVRLVYEKWGDGDFLLGSADEYRSLSTAHLKQLIAVLDTLHDRKISVILTPLTLPGARNRQKNGNRRDGRLWQRNVTGSRHGVFGATWPPPCTSIPQSRLSIY